MQYNVYILDENANEVTSCVVEAGTKRDAALIGMAYTSSDGRDEHDRYEIYVEEVAKNIEEMLLNG